MANPKNMKQRANREGEHSRWEVVDVASFLGLTVAEERMVELRVRISKALRNRRKALGLTQKEAARKLRTRQPNVAKMELALPGVTLDRMLQALLELDVTLEEVATVIGQGAPSRGLQGRSESSGPTLDLVDGSTHHLEAGASILVAGGDGSLPLTCEELAHLSAGMDSAEGAGELPQEFNHTWHTTMPFQYTTLH